MLSKLLNTCKLIIRSSSLPSSFLKHSPLKINPVFIRKQSNESTRSLKEILKSNFGGRNGYRIPLYSLSLMALLGFPYSIFVYGSPDLNEDGTYKNDRFSSMNYFASRVFRTFSRFRDFYQTVQDPISDKLLPDPHPLYQPLTLVIEVNDVLLHPEWTFKSGWKFKKRPGLELFLEAVSPFFEVVVFTNDTAMNLHPILHQLDPNFQSLHYRLYREATRYKGGVHIKDLSTINRDMRKVIRVDWDRYACEMQPENTFLMKRWSGDPNDRDLVDLAAFLRMMATNNLPDVREGLAYYATFDDPLREFRQRCETLKVHLKESQDTDVKKKKYSFNNLLSKLIK